MTNSPYRVLVIEDDPLDAKITLRELQGSPVEFMVERAKSLSDALELLSEKHLFDVFVTDLGLPDSAGTESVQELRRLCPDVPIVVLSGWDEAFTDKLMRAGASTFVCKDSPKGMLHKAILDAIEMKATSADIDPGRLDPEVSGGVVPDDDLTALVTELRFQCGDLLANCSEGPLRESAVEIASLSKRIYNHVRSGKA